MIVPGKVAQVRPVDRNARGAGPDHAAAGFRQIDEKVALRQLAEQLVGVETPVALISSFVMLTTFDPTG